MGILVLGRVVLLRSLGKEMGAVGTRKTRNRGRWRACAINCGRLGGAILRCSTGSTGATILLRRRSNNFIGDAIKEVEWPQPVSIFGHCEEDNGGRDGRQDDGPL